MLKKVKSASKSVPIQVPSPLASQKGDISSTHPPINPPHAHGKTVFAVVASVLVHAAQKYVFARESNHNFIKTFVAEKQEIHGCGAQKKREHRPPRKQTYAKDASKDENVGRAKSRREIER